MPGLGRVLNCPLQNGSYGFQGGRRVDPGQGLVEGEQPPGLAFHILGDDRRLTTQYRVVI
ncbi:hypothetical protein ACIBL5_11900 [Streptomyces sp. NPDC050516]|uniref:hypothetical protein n=1 Tax=Streptomyces sp. NPDC050516 TaxID=3365621 RepID=UPI003799D2A6